MSIGAKNENANAASIIRNVNWNQVQNATTIKAATGKTYSAANCTYSIVSPNVVSGSSSTSAAGSSSSSSSVSSSSISSAGSKVSGSRPKCAATAADRSSPSSVSVR